MKKTFKYYVVLWFVLWALFNVISFVTVGHPEQEKYTPSFWIGYIFITLAFIGQFVCTYFALKKTNIKKTFYNVSLSLTSYAGLILSFIFGGLCMLISTLPYWIGIVLCFVVITFNVSAVIKAAATIELVNSLDEKIKTQTFFIKALTVDADTLMASAKTEEAKKECRKVYEAIRYSDPMSNDALASVESQITLKFAELSEAVKADDTLYDSAKITAIANELCILADDRNKKCKLLK